MASRAETQVALFYPVAVCLVRESSELALFTNDDVFRYLELASAVECNVCLQFFLSSRGALEEFAKFVDEACRKWTKQYPEAKKCFYAIVVDDVVHVHSVGTFMNLKWCTVTKYASIKGEEV